MSDETQPKKTKAGSDPVVPNEIAYHYIKGNNFRVIHSNGAVGGISSRGEISMNLFSERPAIPRFSVFEIQSDGSLGGEKIELRDCRSGAVREVEISVLMSAIDAETLGKWLLQKVESHRALVAKHADKPPSESAT